MGVLTHKEYLNLKKPVKKAVGRNAPAKQDIQKEVKEEVPVYEYHLLHPENSLEGDLQNFEDVLKLNGKEYQRVCKGGIVRTRDEVLKNFLTKKGYILMEKVLIDG